MHNTMFCRSWYSNSGIWTISVSWILSDSLYLILPFIVGNGGPYIYWDLLTSTTKIGLFIIQLYFTIRKNFSLAMWFVFRFSMTALVDFWTSRFLKIFLLSDAVFKNENASFSLDMCMLPALKWYRQGKGPCINFIMCAAKMYTKNAFSSSLSRVTWYFSVTSHKYILDSGRSESRI